jgi:hypothetical protein
MKTPEQREQAQLDMLARKEQKRADARRASARNAMRKRRRTLERKNIRHVQEWRAKKKAEKKAERHAVLMAEKAARDIRRVARQEKKALDLRKHATQRQGFCDGYNAAAPMTEAQLKGLSYAKRYRIGYAEGRAEKQRVDVLLLAQRSRLTPTPVTIQLT